ncbi:unnamed protein product [Urochloa decumbens]|uniref:CCHC-type domain-containing protein n=1 Tax=Urochloa decumbens TaxID=240449 RepID=A0ABC9CFS9_9POAL
MGRGHQVWYTEESMGGKRRTAPAIWSRLGPGGGIHGVTSGQPRSNGGGWLATLKAKAGAKRCYNCLSAGHFIAACRDPPRCLHCSRFGHKAFGCHYLPRSAFSSRAAAAAAACSPTAPAPRAAACASTAPAPRAAAAAAPGAATAAAALHAASDASAPRVAGAPAVEAMEEDGYALYARTPGAAERRPGHVQAGAPRTDAIRQAEHDLETFALIAVQVDARVRLEPARIQQEAVRQLHVPCYELGFLLRFDNQVQRDAARRHGAMRIGHVRLQLLPWMRQVGARDALSKFYYQVRLCIEGVPVHARNAESVAGLLPKPSFVDDLDCDMEKPEEEECFRLWIWTTVPDEIATTGTLHLEEPVTLPQEGYADSLMELGMPMGALRCEEAKTMDYDVIIHVDRIHDYRPRPARLSPRSIDSPDEDTEDEWPVKHPFLWSLGVPDGQGRQANVQRRSVLDRLGDRGRDRSPPRGGGASGLGLRQMPPSGPHHLPDFRGGRGSNFHHGSGSRQGGGQHHRRGMNAARMGWRWKAKNSGTAPELGPREQKGKGSYPGSQDAEDSFHIRESLGTDRWVLDPMIDEAGWGFETGQAETGQARPARQQCSVEPTAVLEGLAEPEVPFLSSDEETVVQLMETQSKQGVKETVEEVVVPSCLLSESHAVLEDITSAVVRNAGNEEGAQPAMAVHMDMAKLGIEAVLATDAAQAAEHADAVVTRESEEVLVIPVHEAFGHVQNMANGPLAVQADGDVGQIDIASVGARSGTGPQRALFDLNLGCEGLDEEHVLQPAPNADRHILGAADARLNKDARASSGARPLSRGIARFAVPLKKSLLCAPAGRTKPPQFKKGSSSDSAHGDRRGPKPNQVGAVSQSVDDKAAARLMRAAGVIGENEQPTVESQLKFYGEFVAPMQGSKVADMRQVFGLPDVGAGSLQILAVDAEE